MKLSQTLLCLALAVAAASAASVDVSDMHSKLAAVDPSLAAISSSKASTLGYAKDDYYKDDYYKYESKYDDKYSKYEKKYDDKYEKYDDKYEKKYDDKYEKKYDDKYEKKYDDKYEKKYDSKYEKKYDEYEYSDKYYEPKAYEHYGYGDSKLTVKLWEKSRSTARLQSDANPNTYMFTSIVTCENPKHVKDAHSTDGIIDMPVNPELKVTPVGQCDWTVTKVTEQKISEHAAIKGSTSVICTFTEEAERQCKGDFLCDKMSVSAAGLLYHFDQTQDYSSYKKEYEYKKEGAETTEMDMDVMLSLINGVNGSKHKGEYDNGVVQFFYGPEGADKTEIKKADYDAKDATGSITMVFKKA